MKLKPEGHCDIYAFKENFGSSVADGLEWDKTRGKNMTTNSYRKSTKGLN